MGRARDRQSVARPTPAGARRAGSLVLKNPDDTPMSKAHTSDKGPPRAGRLPNDQEPADAARASNPTPTTPPRLGAPDSISPYVLEIREKLAEIAVREAAVRRRERELDAWTRRVQEQAQAAARRELAEVRSRLAKRDAELEAQAAALAARADQLRELKKRIATRQAKQDRQATQVRESGIKLGRQREQDQATIEQARQNLIRRVAVIRHSEGELCKRVELARDDLAQQRRQADELRGRLDERDAELQRARDELGANQSRWDGRFAELSARDDDFASRKSDLDGRGAELDRQRNSLRQWARELEQQRRAIVDKEGAFETETRHVHEHEQTLARQRETVEARFKALQEKQAKLDGHVRRLQRVERELQQKRTRLDTDQSSLAELSDELEARQTKLRELQARAEEIESEAQRHRAEAENLREQMDARDADSRQSALALEVETDRIEQERTAIELAHDELADVRNEREREFDGLRTNLARRAAQLEQAERSALAAPKLWWARSSALAAVIAAAAAASWFLHDAPTYRGTALLRIRNESGSQKPLAREHAAALQSPGLIEGALSDPVLKSAWVAALEAGRVRVVPASDGAEMVLAIDQADRALARAVVDAAADAYMRRVNSVPTGMADPDSYRDLSARDAAVHAELSGSEQRLAEWLPKLEQSPMPQEHERLLREVTASRQALDDSIAGLEQARESRATLTARGVPRGMIDPQAFEQRLSADRSYREDGADLDGVKRSYRDELAVALVPLSKPLDEMIAALEAFEQAAQQQLELNPPAQVRPAVEECATLLEERRARLTHFARTWRGWRQKVKRPDAADDVVGLVTLQTTASEGAGRTINLLRAMLVDIDKSIGGLAEGGGGRTRGVVVATELRRHFNDLSDRFDALAYAGRNMDLTSNFRLDAQDRRLRGVRKRMNHRRETVRAQMQLEADQLARRQHERRLAELRRTIDALERRRGSLVVGLVDQADALRELDGQLRVRRGLESQIEGERRREQRLQSELEQIAAALAEARRSGPKPDRIEIAALRTEPIAGMNRGRNTALVGGASFAAAWLVCLLMIIKNPLRRRALGEAEPASLPTSGVLGARSQG